LTTKASVIDEFVASFFDREAFDDFRIAKHFLEPLPVSHAWFTDQMASQLSRLRDGEASVLSVLDKLRSVACPDPIDYLSTCPTGCTPAHACFTLSCMAQYSEDLTREIATAVTTIGRLDYEKVSRGSFRNHVPQYLNAKVYFDAHSQGKYGCVWDYLSELQSDEQEKLCFLEHVLPSTSYFFRPDLLEDLAFLERTIHKRRWRILVIGSSTGAEAYTVLLYLGQLGVSCELVAVDRNPAAVAFAETAQYPASLLDDIPAEYGHGAPGQSLRTQFAGAAQFVCADVLESLPPQLLHSPYDVVLCRNVLKYLTRNDVRRAVSRIREILTPDSYFLIGSDNDLIPDISIDELPGLNRITERITQIRGG